MLPLYFILLELVPLHLFGYAITATCCCYVGDAGGGQPRAETHGSTQSWFCWERAQGGEYMEYCSLPYLFSRFWPTTDDVFEKGVTSPG